MSPDGSQDHLKVTPAHLSFLAIYNPSLGRTDDTFRDQIVFYYSRTEKSRRRHGSKGHGDDAAQIRQDENERLRQIGLAQGMVGFARSFSGGDPVSSIDTEKSRIIQHELERNWWILALVGRATRIPIIAAPSGKSTATDASQVPVTYEYSSREVSPAALLLQQLLSAQSVFLLHHGRSLSDLFDRAPRVKFCNTLERFWNRYASGWDVLLHGNPAVDIYGGIKLAAGGELGMGVGEEEWGSGEREVLEDFTGRTEGLIDLLVCRFGEPSPAQNADGKTKTETKERQALLDTLEPWMGIGKSPDAADGVIFSGVGAISRSSIRNISNWVQTIYAFGEYAYGVKDNPGSDRKKRRRNLNENHSNSSSKTTQRKPPMRRQPLSASSAVPQSKGSPRPGIPPPIVSAAQLPLENTNSSLEGSQRPQTADPHINKPLLGDSETWMKYLTLGYSSWGASNKMTEELPQATQAREAIAADESEKEEAPSLHYLDPEPDIDHLEEKIKFRIQEENTGHFIVGLQGDLEDELEEGDEEATESSSNSDWNSRMLLRTIHVDLVTQAQPNPSVGSSQTSDSDLTPRPPWEATKMQRLRVLVYVHRPFIYIFLFDPRTESLVFPAFYKHLHTYFAPLHKPLSASTSPARVAARIAASSNPYTTSASPKKGSAVLEEETKIYDLVWDPQMMTIHTSLPSIPDPSRSLLYVQEPGVPTEWTRVEALNVHSQILATIEATRHAPYEIEQTAKTGKGWWVVWMRLPASSASPPPVPLPPSSSQDQPLAHHSDAGGSAPSIRTNTTKTISETGETETDVDTNADTTTTTSHIARGKAEAEPESRIEDLREAFLVRKARDAPTAKSQTRTSSSMWRLGVGGTSVSTGGQAAGWGPARLAEGIGIDARRYVEGLLSLNR